MLSRAVISFAILWAFIALPSLCGAGLLPHACQQHDSANCGHEGGCQDDPCAKFAPAAAPSVSRADPPESWQPTATLTLDTLATFGRLIQYPVLALQLPCAFAPSRGDRLPLLI